MSNQLIVRDLIARDAELTEVVAAVHDRAGAVISGEAGVGKTALARAVAERIATGGDDVAWIVATAAGRDIPFGALAPLVPEGVASIHPTLVLGAVARRLREHRRPLVVVDDAHLLDDGSAATVLGLMTSGTARILATVRTGEPAPDAVHTLWKDGFVAATSVNPFDREATRGFLAGLLGGEVASTAAAVLWQQTRGNALYLSEIARDGRRSGQFFQDGGVWMWRGTASVPARLADLLDRRFEGLTATGLDALGLLVLAEPLSLDGFRNASSTDGLAELEQRGLVEQDRQAGTVVFRFAHPLLGAAAARLVSPTRRSRLADVLSRSGHHAADIVRRATWQLDSSTAPDVDVLVAGGRAVLLSRPALTERLAERAVPFDDGPAAALMLADAHAEQGDVAGARRAQGLAMGRVRTDDDLMAVRLNEISLTTFSNRRPDLALDAIEAAKAELPQTHHVDLDSVASLVTVFATRPVEALAIADRVLTQTTSRPSVIRASSTRVIALTLIDRPDEARRAADELSSYVAAGPASPYAQGVASLAIELARHVALDGDRAPLSDPAAGRWIIASSAVDGERRVGVVVHPLFDGVMNLMRGFARLAVAPLREALTQQRAGEGLLRSEATSLLAIALAATGRGEEAERLLVEAPPDRLAIYPGLADSAAAAIAASAGRPSAVDLSLAAAAQARAAGAVISAVAYLADAGRYGGARRAARLLDELGREFNTPITAARAIGLRARATGDGKALLEAADRHVELGLIGPAKEFAELAGAALGRNRSDASTRAQSLARELSKRLNAADPSPAPVVPLTRRELEVAKLAAKGMADRDIATVLTVSVRTVESHVSAAYRKLDIRSRNGLRTALEALGVLP